MKEKTKRKKVRFFVVTNKNEDSEERFLEWTFEGLH